MKKLLYFVLAFLISAPQADAYWRDIENMRTSSAINTFYASDGAGRLTEA